MRNLNIKMAEFQEVFESGAKPYNVSQKQVEVMHEFDKELQATGILEQVLRPGNKFPEFALLNRNGLTVKLTNLLIRGPVVINFFRGIWCPYCNLELQALQQSLIELEGAGASLVAISPQLPAVNKRTMLQNKLMFDILSDVGNILSEKIGIAYHMTDEMIERVYKAFGVDLSTFNGDDSWRLPVSSRFVIDTDGTIVASHSDVNYRKRPDPSETVSIVKAITRRSSI